MKRVTAAILVLLMLVMIAPVADADSGPPWATGLDNLNITEQDPWENLDSAVTVASNTNNFGEGYLEFNITAANNTDKLQVTDNGSLTIVGSAVYWGADRIGTVDNIKNGSAGMLRINFSSIVPLTNADFETGNLTGWTFNNAYPGVNAQAWVESPAASPGGNTVDGTPLVDDNGGTTQSETVQSGTKFQGEYALQLTISGQVTTGYGTMHGPMAISDTFNAAAGDNLSVTWNAVYLSDWYDVYGFVFKDDNNNSVWDDAESYQKLFHGCGQTTGGWITTTQTIGAGVAGSNLRFAFLNGTYDKSGGRAVGSYLYIDGIQLQLAAVGTTVTDAIVQHIIENTQYQSTTDDPPAYKDYAINFKESNNATGFSSARINITAINDFPTDITLSNNHIAENLPPGTLIGNLTTTDADNVTWAYTMTGGDTGNFTISGTQLLSAVTYDFETDNSFSVDIRTDDGAGGTFDKTFAITVDNIVDDGIPVLASVTLPVNNAHYNAGSIPVSINGTVGDSLSTEEGSGLNANTTTFTLRRSSDSKYWNGAAWVIGISWLATTHSATTADNTTLWTDNIALPAWANDTYTIQAKAVDTGANTFTGTAITFIYDTVLPGVTLNDITDTVSALTTISGNSTDTLPGLVDIVQVSVRNNSTGLYWDGAGWGVPQVWLNATSTTPWSYNAASISLTNGNPYTLYAKAVDKAGNESVAASDTFTYSAPAGGGGGGGAAPPGDESVLAIALGGTATDTNGMPVYTQMGYITVDDSSDTMTISLPIRLLPGQFLGTYSDDNGVTFENNILTIPDSPGATGDFYFRVSNEDGNIGSEIVLETTDAHGNGLKTEADVLSIHANTNYTSADLTSADPSLGEVSSSIGIDLNTLPQNASIKITTSQLPNSDTATAFQLASTEAGFENFDVAYTINVEKTNLENGTDIADASITMKVGADWVDAHGGIDNIKIIRFNPETGENEVLATTFLGYDEEGRAIFSGFSPNGLSIFGLIGVIIPEPTPTTVVPPPTTPPPTVPPVIVHIPTPASLTVSSLKANPATTISGHPVVITGVIKNSGETDGDYTAYLEIDGATVETMNAAVPAGQTITLSFTVTKEAGTYEITLGDQSFTLEVGALPVSGPGLWWILIGAVIAVAAFAIFRIILNRTRHD